MKTVLVELHLCDKDAAGFRAGQLSLSVAASANRGSSYNVIPDSDAHTTERFVEMCERTGAAETARCIANVRDDDSKLGISQWGFRRALRLLNLTSLLTPPDDDDSDDRDPDGAGGYWYPVHDADPPAETCATCGGHLSFAQGPREPSLRPCPACGGDADAG